MIRVAEAGMKAHDVVATSCRRVNRGRSVPSGKRVEPRVLKMNARRPKRSLRESLAGRQLVEALAALVLLLAMLLVLLAPP
jgi:hypothetical protein